MQPEILETPRLFLKRFNQQTMDELFATAKDEEIILHLGLDSQAALEVEKTKYKKGLSNYRISFENFKLIEKDSRRTIGGCGFHTWYPDHQRAEIGYALYQAGDMAKGYMSEAMQSILNFGFQQMNLNRVEACIGPGNMASIALVKKMGFYEEGLLRQHFKKDNVVQDSLIFSLLKQEWYSR